MSLSVLPYLLIQAIATINMVAAVVKICPVAVTATVEPLSLNWFARLYKAADCC